METTVSTPLTELLLFLAAFFAPTGATELEIMNGQEMAIYENIDDMWVSKSDANHAYVIRGAHVLSSSGLFKVDATDIYEHRWSSESVLKVDGLEVLKTRDGLIIYPEGIHGDKEPISIIYGGEIGKGPMARRRVIKQ